MKKLLSRYHLAPSGLMTGIAMLMLVALTSCYSYLLFHSLVELFTVVIAIGVFILTWNSQRFLKNNYIIIVGFSSLFIGLLDMLHMLAYKGMGVFNGFDANLPTQLWIGARYFQAIVLILAPLMLRIVLPKKVLLVCFSTITGILIIAIFLVKVFPDCFIEGHGLTQFKIFSEYCIVSLLIASSTLLYRIRAHFESTVFNLLLLSTALFACAEIAFTAYLSVYGIGNFIGHLLRVISFYALYRAIIVTGLVAPLDLIFRELQQSKRTILHNNTTLEYKINERTQELKASNRLLQQEIADRKRAQQKSRRRVAQLKALRAIDVAIARSFDLNHTLSVVLNEAIGELNVDAAAILLYNPDNKMLEYRAGKGFKANTIQFSSMRLETDITLQHPVKLFEIRSQFVHDNLCATENFMSYFNSPLTSAGKYFGIIELYSRREKKVTIEWYEFLETLAGQTAIAIDNATMFHELESTNILLRQAYEVTMEGWIKALDLRDKETEGHTQRVADITVQLASSMGIPQNEIINMKRGALLHDIGKIGIPDKILNKPGPLDENEWKIMRLHPIHAYNMLSPIKYLGSALEIPYCHHERWDSSGYPQSLRKEDIPLSARIFAVVDVWDALCSDRPYRAAMKETDVLAFINEQSGKHFDPRVVESFMQLHPHVYTRH